MSTNHGFCHTHSAPPASPEAIDPVCGMTVDPAKTSHHARHAGQDYHFCSSKCRERFVARPEIFLEGASPPPPAAAADAVYTCPMHPEIEQIGPGTCPLCGMALEPKVFTLAHGPSEEYLDMRRRFIVSAVLTAPLAVLAMLRHLWPVAVEAFGARTLDWVELVLATPVVLWGGAPFFVRGWQSIKNRYLNMFTLIAIGTGVAWTYSLVGAVAPQLFPPSFRDMHGGVGLYFEAAAEIVTLVLLGQVLELRARERTGSAIRLCSI